jgi:hypothetical protein
MSKVSDYPKRGQINEGKRLCRRSFHVFSIGDLRKGIDINYHWELST